jgi:hypothetical protein
MSRAVIPVDRKKFEAAITSAEANGGLANNSILATKVADIYNKMSPPKPITFSVVLLRIRDWKIVVKTVPGKRGRAAGVKMSPEHKQAMLDGRKDRKSRGEKFKKNPKYNAAVSAMKQVCVSHNKQQYLPLVDLVVKGSTNASKKLNCLMCTSFQTQEVRKCSDLSCAWWLSRPYQNVKTDEDVVAEDEKFMEKATAEEELASVEGDE